MTAVSVKRSVEGDGRENAVQGLGKIMPMC